MVKERYSKSTFSKFENHPVKVDLDTDYVTDESLVVKEFPIEGKKSVFSCMADNMRLPFDNESFDCYISNLSLMIVPNHSKQIQECYRVLKPGSYACFTVWGRPENTINFTVQGKA